MKKSAYIDYKDAKTSCVKYQLSIEKLPNLNKFSQKIVAHPAEKLILKLLFKG